MTNKGEEMNYKENPAELSSYFIKIEIDDLVHDLAVIKTQLSANQAAIMAGEEHLDNKWTHKAVTAKRFKTLRLNVLREELAKRKKAEKNERMNCIDRAFVDAARELLPAATFFSILEMANSKFEQTQS